MGAVLVMVPVAVYRHHDHNNFKEKSVIRAGLQFQRISPLLSLQEVKQHTSRHVVAEGAESSTLAVAGNRKKERQTMA